MEPDYDAVVSKVPCSICGRMFNEDRLGVHVRICKKAANKPKKVYDAASARVDGTEAAKYKRQASKAKAAAPKKKTNWRAKSEAFRMAMRAGRDPNAPPPPSLEENDYVTCDSCGRTFSEAAADRHIPKCRSSQGIRNPLPRGSSSASSKKTNKSSTSGSYGASSSRGTMSKGGRGGSSGRPPIGRRY